MLILPLISHSLEGKTSVAVGSLELLIQKTSSLELQLLPIRLKVHGILVGKALVYGMNSSDYQELSKTMKLVMSLMTFIISTKRILRQLKI